MRVCLHDCLGRPLLRFPCGGQGKRRSKKQIVMDPGKTWRVTCSGLVSHQEGLAIFLSQFMLKWCLLPYFQHNKPSSRECTKPDFRPKRSKPIPKYQAKWRQTPYPFVPHIPHIGYKGVPPPPNLEKTQLFKCQVQENARKQGETMKKKS